MRKFYLHRGESQIPVECDGIGDKYHTMHELYQHRMALFIALTRALADIYYCFRSKLHSDGTMFEGDYFIVGMLTNQGQITYHYKLKHWDKFEHCSTVDLAPEYASPEDSLQRLEEIEV